MSCVCKEKKKRPPASLPQEDLGKFLRRSYDALICQPTFAAVFQAVSLCTLFCSCERCPGTCRTDALVQTFPQDLWSCEDFRLRVMAQVILRGSCPQLCSYVMVTCDNLYFSNNEGINFSRGLTNTLWNFLYQDFNFFLPCLSGIILSIVEESHNFDKALERI